jgi:hypothetical protein
MSDALQRISAALAGRYLVERELGRGGMATVYLARDLKHHRAVAIKVLSDEISAAVGADRFLREIEIAASLTHPNILPLLDSGETGGRDSQPYYVMPFIEGESLRDRMRREGQLPVDEAVRLAREVADALHHAHERGVVHRDIKPENILLAGGHAMVADFGVARALTQPGVQAITKTGMAVGTPQYMSPEQAAADPSVDGRSDQYALGTLLYEMLAGSAPYPGPTAHAILARKMSGPPPSLRVVRPTVSDALERAVFKSMEIVPADRFQSAQAFGSALEGAITPAGTSATTAVVRVPAGRRTVLRWLVAAGVVAVLALVALKLLGSAPAAPVDAQVVAVLPFRVSEADTSIARYRIGMLELLHASLNGEGGPRAVSPATVLSAWRRTVSSESEDLAEPEALDLARRLGAGQLLTGSIVAAPGVLRMHATLLPTGGGRPVEAQSEGSPDSVLAVVDRLVADLLVRSSVGAARPQLSSLTTTSLPALKSFLDGQAAYRGGDYRVASTRFREAVALDSSFALAAMGFARAAGWGGGGSLAQGVAIAQRSRARLSSRDRAQLDEYATTISREQLKAVERLVQLAPDDPEAHFELGDVLYHYGSLMDYPQPMRGARTAFERSVALDSGFSAPLEHLIDLTAATGDTASLRRFFELRRDLVARGAAPLRFQHLWAYANAFEDHSLLDSLRGAIRPETRSSVLAEGAARAVDMPTVELLLATMRRNPRNDGERRLGMVMEAQVAMNAGQPVRAARILDTLASEPAGLRTAQFFQVTGGLYGQLDTMIAARVAASITRQANAVSPADSVQWRDRWQSLAVAQLWHGSGREASGLDQAIQMSRAAIGSPATASYRIDAALWATLLEALRESRGSSAGPALMRLDSLAATGPQQNRTLVRIANLETARLFEQAGDPARALRAVRRHTYDLGDYSFVATVAREEGRLAALTGDKPGAIAAYQKYLRFRTDPEPGLVPERDRIKAELARLLGEPR